MSKIGRGKADHSLAKGSFDGHGMTKASFMKRHFHGRRVIFDAITGITKADIRRMARRGGVKRMSGLVHEEMLSVLEWFLRTLIRRSITYTEHARRKTVAAMDVVYALKSGGKTMYGFCT